MIAWALRYWWVLVIAALAGALSVQSIRLSAAQATYSAHLADDAVAQTAATEAARQKEQRDQAAYDEEAQRARNERKEQEAAIAALADTGGRLRDELAEYKRRARTAPANPPNRGTGLAGADPLDMLADLYARADGRAGEMALYADALRRAGSACERSADALTR